MPTLNRIGTSMFWSSCFFSNTSLWKSPLSNYFLYFFFKNYYHYNLINKSSLWNFHFLNILKGASYDNDRYITAYYQNPYKYKYYLLPPTTGVKNQFYPSDIYIFEYLGQVFVLSTFFFHKTKALSKSWNDI